MLTLNRTKIEQAIGTVVGFLTPLIVQLATGDIGWTATAGADAGVVAVWLLAHAHVSAPAVTALSTVVRDETTGLLQHVAVTPTLTTTAKIVPGLAVKR